MIKNIVIAVLAFIVVIEGGFLWKGRHVLFQAVQTKVAAKMAFPPAGPNAKGAGRPVILGKGANLKTSPLFAYAYQVVPGPLSDKAKKALTGFAIVSKTQTDGSVLVTLTPKNSEDQNQQYVVKTGQVLYFVEQTPFDDKADSDTDLNYRDDYGLIVDQNGIVQ